MLLEKKIFTVNDEMDFVNITFGTVKARISYKAGFDLDQYLRTHAKNAARLDRVSARFVHEVDVPELEKYLKPNRKFRQSRLLPSVRTWDVASNPQLRLVRMSFDSMSEEMDYETAVKLARAVRRASRRAKAWAGDVSRHSRCLGHLSDAEEDYRLGIAS